MSLPTNPPPRRERAPLPLSRRTQPSTAHLLSHALRKNSALLWALGAGASDASRLRVIDVLLGAVVAAAAPSPRRARTLSAATLGVAADGAAPPPRGAMLVWGAPSDRRAVFERATAVRLAAALWAAVGAAAARRVLALVDAVAAAGKSAVEGGVCYQIWAVAAAEMEIGEGAAEKLMREVLERVDATGVPCCSVVFEGRGETFFERLGFVDVGKAKDMPKGAPEARVWVRWPRGI